MASALTARWGVSRMRMKSLSQAPSAGGLLIINHCSVELCED
jgi:hypothetical protein